MVEALDHVKYMPKSAWAASRPSAYAQVSYHNGTCSRTGLIIRRSWVRAPPAPPGILRVIGRMPWTGSWTEVGGAIYRAAHAFRSHRATAERNLACQAVRGKDPLTGREIPFRKTCKTERGAQIELGKLLALARAGRPVRYQHERVARLSLAAWEGKQWAVRR